MKASTAAIVTAQKTARQPKASMMKLPVSGARIGDTLNTSIKSDISLVASGPVCRSRTTARGTTMPVDRAQPLQQPEEDQPLDVGRQRRADAGDREDDEAAIHDRLAAIHVGQRPDDQRPDGEGEEDDDEAHLHGERAGAEIGADGRQGRQVHVDCEGADGRNQAEHDRDAEES